MILPPNQSEAVTSLLSLSIASSGPITSANTSTTTTAAAATMTGKHHRRLGSTGKARRRLSDAREASARPSFAPSSAPLSSILSSLSLSASPGSSTSFSAGCKPLAPKPPSNGGITVLSNSSSNPVPVHDATQPQDDAPTYPSSTNLKPGKKRGIDYRCESCSKIYRHPNCLNKHRWEHTKQWREASKFVSSKHQQVQLLEAATILSYMGSSCSTSLPEDRSEWPTFLSGGVLPKPSVEEAQQEEGQSSISSSVPTGPRMHDYALGKGAVTQLRPGLLGVPTPPEVKVESPQNTTSAPVHTQQYPTSMSMPMGVGYTHAPYSGSFSYGSYGSYGGGYGYAPYGVVPTHASSVAPTEAQGEEVEIDIDIDDSPSNPNEVEEVGWSLPASSLRSAPSLISSSRSRSGSGSGTGSLGDPTSSRGRSGSDGEEEEEEEEDHQIQIRVEMEGDLEHMDGVESHFSSRKVHSINLYPGPLDEEEGEDAPPPTTLTKRATSATRAIPRSPHSYGRLSHASSPAKTRYSHSRSRSGGYPTPPSFGRRGLGMKREEDDSAFLSDGFSVREEPEPERDDIDSREKEGRWDGLEMEVDMDMD